MASARRIMSASSAKEGSLSNSVKDTEQVKEQEEETTGSQDDFIPPTAKKISYDYTKRIVVTSF